MKIRQNLLLILTFLAACALLIFPAEAATGAKNGICYCLQILVPSLYPFMVLSVFIVKSGLSDKIGKIFEGPCRTVLKLPGSAAATILMSAVGGYPTGARGIASLYERGSLTEKQAARMLCFCVNAGPAFVISAVGAGFLRNARAGGILFASQLIASFFLSILCSIPAKNETVPRGTGKQRKTGMADALVLSAADAAHAMVGMCCFVILFAAFLNLFRIWVTHPAASAALSAFMEVTGGCSDLTKLGVPLWAFSLAIGWGGVSVHFQILSFFTNVKVPLARFVFYRVLHGLLAALTTVLLMRAFPVDTEAFSNIARPLTPALSGSVPASAALIFLCIALIICLPREKLEFEDT
ncbi:sporulation protein [Caproiciproducens galactitolivorans]|uniref:Sporulation integral membrane protein YlbJ n=1 Tax=Caproiciproducens galactitolivorans TaxID=642589 RepID=A0A4Z0YD28_9FIRM|nr:sporulation protein [Caproiciproducens galactitolivorans]QEY35830.1 sporulation protein [Caproiciproducens galactitolivorans]TGJ75746.1 sporulation integral membrane protein YlbJ [Caproiciproducens galactitolivorans]